MLKVLSLVVLVVAGMAFQLTLDEPNLTDKEILQQVFNGLFEENKLADPTTVVPCFDDATAHKTVVFVGEVLDKAAKGSLADLLALKDIIQKFADDFDPKVQSCLDGNKELLLLGAKYGIDGDTPASDVEKKIITYVTLHYLETHGWFVNLDKLWKDGKYYQVGFDAAGYGHKVLKMSIEESNLTDKEILQQLLNGLFEPNKLPDPTTIVPCFDDSSAHLTVDFIGKILHEAALASLLNPSEIQKIKDEAEKFTKALPESVKTCLNDNQELKNLGLKYGIDDKTDTDKLEKQILAYIALHYLEVHKELQGFDNDWHKGSYKKVGTDMAAFGHKLIKLTAEDVRKVREAY